jgi:hypothetical protein
VDKVRPPGDRVTIDVVVLAETADTRQLEVRMTSDFFGSRSHVQIWRQQQGHGRFDAQATLAKQEEAVPRRTSFQRRGATDSAHLPTKR